MTRVRGIRVAAVLGIILFAFSLRSAVASLSPVIGRVEADFDVPTWVIGLLGTAPPVCFAVFGLLAPQLERRLGLERLALVAIGAVALGLLGRGIAPGSILLVVATAVIFAGVGIGNILLPPIVKKYFPDRIGLMTTLYSTTMAFSTFLPPLLAVPVADAAGWRISLGMWAVFALAALVPWVTLITRTRTDAAADDLEEPAPRVFRRMWRLPMAWAIMIVFLASSATAYTFFAWLPTMMVDIAGVTTAQAGSLLSLFGVMGLPASLLVPVLVSRYRVIPALFVIAITCGVAGFAGLLFAPAWAPWIWIALVGIMPLFFPLSLVLLGLRTRTHEGAVALSGFVQSVGYGATAAVPLLVGMLHEATGQWSGALIVLAIITVAAIPAGFIAGRPRTVEEEWEKRHGSWR